MEVNRKDAMSKNPVLMDVYLFSRPLRASTMPIVRGLDQDVLESLGDLGLHVGKLESASDKM